MNRPERRTTEPPSDRVAAPAQEPSAEASARAGAPRPEAPSPVQGGFVDLDGEQAYRITGYDRMPAFFMSIPSSTDLWMFLSSRGGLTAGRVDAEGALFPYETVDRLLDGHLHTGPITRLRIRHQDGRLLRWSPFSSAPTDDAAIERAIVKNVVGNRVVFEERHLGLGLCLRSQWSACDEFGFVRSVSLQNLGAERVSIELLDGLRNVLPAGPSLALQQQASCLVDAYKRVDCDPRTGLGIFSLTAKILDRAEAAESLRANVVWTTGLDAQVCLSARALETFEHGGWPKAETLLTGRRGNHFSLARFDLAPGETRRWHVVADVGLRHAEIVSLSARLQDAAHGGDDLHLALERGVERATEELRSIVASADGVQTGEQEEASAHHFANVLYNTMRGGIFVDGHEVPRDDLLDFVTIRNRALAERRRAWFEALPESIRVDRLLEAAREVDDADLERLCLEALPLYFGRRHGDPSRPWNRFSIHVRDEEGRRTLHHEGNWRDIFQNWEALSTSFPAFLPNMVARFVNASTLDGFNPYRVTREGVDWEVVDPDDPWSYIGYWGDHQIIYLLKLLEALDRSDPEALGGMLGRRVFSYAQVPYRLAPYEEILADPHHTIDFDTALAERIEERVATLGTDGKLVPSCGEESGVLHATLVEKLLVPLLSKLSNLVVDSGIWMNTQRPEWNDANNALVGHGVSVVTLAYLRRHLAFLRDLFTRHEDLPAVIHDEVWTWAERVLGVLNEHRSALGEGPVDDRTRRAVLDGLGRAFSDYRERVVPNGFSGHTAHRVGDALPLVDLALEYVDHGLRVNRRSDGLAHSYDLLHASPDADTASVAHLDEMLEGQVALLSSGCVDAREAADVVERLYESALYRADQHSFLLQPERVLPSFLEKNAIEETKATRVPLLARLLGSDERGVVERDRQGVVRFAPDLIQAPALEAALDRLATREEWADDVERDREAVLALFEETFHHRAFTGRSGTMYGYEGLGCIYWHMVAKLLLAVQEIALRSARRGESPEDFQRLAALYERIRAGLGYEKGPLEYGAFPTDPYSHTPGHAGAQQPGMTGQVKEEILTRLGELGVEIEDGRVSFRPVLLQAAEFLRHERTHRVLDVDGAELELALEPGQFGFSLCQIPIVYEASQSGAWIRVHDRNGAGHTRPGCELDDEESRALLRREGRIARIDVGIPEARLR